MKLSIILPVRNEAKGISKTLDLICSGIDQIDYEIIAVNDFSDDDTYDIISKKKNSINKIKLFDNAKKGLGGAINLGIEKSNGDAICIMMADLSDDINDLKKYYELIQSENVDAIFGLSNKKIIFKSYF